MKATDLMIGDWLQYYDCNLEKQCNAQVTSIRADGVEPYIQTSDSDVYYSAEEYKPIPLTEEILESNGFVQGDKHEYRVMDSYYNYLEVRCYADTYYEIGNAFDEEGELQSFVDIQYVHELQHALKLCGIEKDIQL